MPYSKQDALYQYSEKPSLVVRNISTQLHSISGNKHHDFLVLYTEYSYFPKFYAQVFFEGEKRSVRKIWGGNKNTQCTNPKTLYANTGYSVQLLLSPPAITYYQKKESEYCLQYFFGFANCLKLATSCCRQNTLINCMMCSLLTKIAGLIFMGSYCLKLGD